MVFDGLIRDFTSEKACQYGIRPPQIPLTYSTVIFPCFTSSIVSFIAVVISSREVYGQHTLNVRLSLPPCVSSTMPICHVMIKHLLFVLFGLLCHFVDYILYILR